MWLPHKTCDKTKLCTNVCTYNKNTNYIHALTTRIPYTGGNRTVVNLMCLTHQIYQSQKFNFWSCFLLAHIVLHAYHTRGNDNDAKYIENFLLYPLGHGTNIRVYICNIILSTKLLKASLFSLYLFHNLIFVVNTNCMYVQ